MIEELKPYLSYCATGVYWLPQVPAHWEIMRSKHVFAERTELARAGDVQLSATQAYGVIPQAEFERRVGRRVVRISMHLDKRNHVEKGDFVISMRSFQGGLERAWASGAIRSSYVVLRRARELDLGYFTHLFKAQPYIKALQATGNFIRDGQDLTFGNYSRVDLPVPPRDEQLAIGRFLDHANRRIDQFIHAKKKLIALLNEQRQAIINRSVTRGLDPNVKLKDSGVPWLGAVPAHWSIQPIKHLLARMDYGTSENLRREGKVRVLTMGHIKNARIQLPKTGALESVPPGLLLERNDLLFNRTNSPDLVGKVGLFEGEANDEVTFASYLIRLRVRQGHRPSWMNYLLNSPGFWGFARSQALVSLHQANLNSTRYARMLVPVPPSQEQQLIVEHIEGATDPIDASTTRAEREIRLMCEYRTRLVADVVTGQLDVRAAVAALPDLEPQIVVNEPSDDEEFAVDEGEAA